MEENDVVQFNEKHKWCGCLGIITEIKDCGTNGIRYMVGVPVPEQRNCIHICNGQRAIYRKNRTG